MSRYTADSRDRVRDAVDMVSLVSSRTELRQRGAGSFFGLCPFHQERTPSFHVRPLEKHYHCFGCQASGDPFDFVMETEGLDFKGALELLAERFGVRLETEAEDPAAASARQRRERLLALLERAAEYYTRYLWTSTEAAPIREYLEGRGLQEATLREFGVGYSPRAWDRILVASRNAGFSDEELLAAGLAQRAKSGRVFDRFRGRIMFPSRDARGRVRGFGARALDGDDGAKYLNSSEGELYHKREQLFGINLARAHASRAGEMILVEGYTDVLAMHQAGLQNTVAIMGTSFTEEQLGELARIVRVLILCLDADRSGQDAMLRASRLASNHTPPLELRAVALPEGTDPAELVGREGAQALQGRVRRSVPFAAFQIERILERGDVRSAEGRDRILAALRPVLGQLPESLVREELVQRIAGRLELSERQLGALLSAPSPAPAAPRTAVGAAIEPLNAITRAERAFLVLCVAAPEAGRRALAAIDPDEHLTSERLRRAARHLAGQIEMPLSGLAPEDDELAQTMSDLVARAGRAGEVTSERLEEQRLVLELRRLERAIIRVRSERHMEGAVDPAFVRGRGAGVAGGGDRFGGGDWLGRDTRLGADDARGGGDPLGGGGAVRGDSDLISLARERDRILQAIRGIESQVETPV